MTADVPAPHSTYSYQPRLMAAPHAFELRPDGLRWHIGARSGLVPYGAIRRVRLSYRPAPLQSHRFLTEIWADGAPRLQLASVSSRGMMDVARQDEAYSGFVAEFHRRMVEAGSGAVFESGKNPIVYWIGLALFVIVALSLAALAVRGLQEKSLAGAAFAAGFLVLFVWQMGNFFRRNRPRRYAAASPPADLLPG